MRHLSFALCAGKVEGISKYYEESCLQEIMTFREEVGSWI